MADVMNNGSAIGIVETSSIAKGFEIADNILKTARVELVVNRTICPGKYMIVVGGDVDAVQSSIESGRQIGAHTVVDHLVIASVHPAVFPAISGVSHLPDLKALGERTITLDCDVLQADGGTRTAAISGSWIALHDAVQGLLREGALERDPLIAQIAAVSVGIYQGEPVLDLDYAEDSNAETDMNVVMDAQGGLVEIQATAEGKTFSRAEMGAMLDRAEAGIRDILAAQRAALLD